MIQQRRMKTMSEIEVLKEKAKKDRKMKAAAQAANQACRYPEELRFNLQPQAGTELKLQNTIRRALGDYTSFKIIKTCDYNKYFGLDDTVPGTPEVNDLDFDNPLNGFSNLFTKQPGKNGTNHVQLKKVIESAKHIPPTTPSKHPTTYHAHRKKIAEDAKNTPSNESAEPKEKAKSKSSKSIVIPKPKPPKLDMRTPSKNEIKNPNKIESILKEMTQACPALTDIETPGKGPGKMFHFPQQPAQNTINGISEKPTVNGGTCQVENSNKSQSSCDVGNPKSGIKKVERDIKRLPGVEAEDSSLPSKRTISTSSTSSSDDSDSESSASSDSESENVEAKQKTTKKTISAINSPLLQDITSPSKMHKTKSPYNNNNNYILNKENNSHAGLSYRNNYAADISLKPTINGFSYGNVNGPMSLTNAVQDETDDSALIDNHTSLFPSPMDIEKTISPLDPENLFDGLIDFPEPNGDNFLGDDLLIPSKNDNDFDRVSTEHLTNNRLKPSNIDDFSEPSLDDSFESNPLILNKLPKKGPGVLYQKDSKINNIKKSTSSDERNKSVSKSNETKDKAKSKSTRSDNGPSVKVNSGSKGHIFRTKAELKSMPTQRRKSSSENSNTDDNSKPRKSNKESAKKNLSEKGAKKEKNAKKERLKSKVCFPRDNNVSVVEINDTEPSNTTSSIPPILTQTAIVINDSTPPKSPIHYTVNDIKVKDECDLFLDVKHETSNIFDNISKSIIGNTISPMNNSPESFTHVRNLIDDRAYEDPPDLVNEEEIKREDQKNSVEEEVYASPLKFPDSDLATVPFKSPLNDFVLDISAGNTTVEEGNISVHHLNFDTSLPPELNEHTPHILKDFHDEPPVLLNNSYDKPNTELLIDDNPYSVSDIANIVPISVNNEPNIVPSIAVNEPPILPRPVNEPILIPVSANEQIVPTMSENEHVAVNGDLLKSVEKSTIREEDRFLHRNCLDPIADFNDLKIPKLTIKIPLSSIKLKNNNHHHRKKTNACGDVQSKDDAVDNSMCPELDDQRDLNLTVEHVVEPQSPLKRKRKLLSKIDDDPFKFPDDPIVPVKIKDTTTKKAACEFKTPNKEEYEKLIIRISLAKLKRAPLKGANATATTSKGTTSPKVKPPKICKLNAEPSDVSANNEKDKEVEKSKLSPAPVARLDTLISTPKQEVPTEEIKTEDMDIEVYNYNSDVSTSDKETKKKRGRPPREKVSTKAEVVKPVKNTDTSETKNDGDTCDSNVCRECGTLRKDYGRDSRRISSYKNTYSTYYNDGRQRKHEADNLIKPVDRAHKYIEAVIKYVQYLIGHELSGKLNILQGVDEYMQITSECIQLVDYVINKYGRKENPPRQSYDVRFTLLCLRLQSILYLKLFKVKKDSAMKSSKALSKYFKQYKAGHSGPPPYHKPIHNRGSTGTPSPSSPSPGPSPGGSVASIGSAGSSGSTGSNDINANGVGYVTIPTDIHEKAFQHLQYSKNLLHGHHLWEDSDLLTSHCQAFLLSLSRKAGQLTMQSTMLHVVDYVTAGLELIKESPHT